VPAAEAYSAGRYAIEAAQAIAEARTLGRGAIVVGGTGLYFKTLIEGLSPIPAIPEDVRRRWRRKAEHCGAGELHKVLAGRDPEMAQRLCPSDPQRVVRALEVLEATGRSLARWQEEPGTPIIDLTTAERLVVEADRDALYRRCDARFEAMMEAGALDEVSALAALGLPAGLPAMRALGVRPLMQHLAGQVSLEEAVAAAKRETRQYVKRQLVWLKRNMNAWAAIKT
jgi:tRNA dimethylallyltransferase